MTLPLRLAIAGLGTVGSATLRLLQRSAALIEARAGRPVQVVAVSAREKNRARDCSLEGIAWVDDPRQLAARADVDVVVELIGGAGAPAKEIAEAALRAGKHLVTANKALLATHGAALGEAAEAQKVRLMFEAAVAGGIPAIKTLREGLAGNRIAAVQGILNGTCNYILTRMFAAKLDFAAALKEAQLCGYAEAEPSTDIDGHDSAHKLALLTALAFGVKPDLSRVTVEGIRRLTALDLRFAADLNYRVKLLGVARETEHGIEQRVGPCLVPLASPLASVDDVLNAVLAQGDAVGDVALSGRGAGGDPTASAVVADIIDLARGTSVLPFSVPVARLREARTTPPEQRFSGWYIRLNVTDQPGVVAEVGAILRDEAISIASLLQYGRSPLDSVPLVITTHTVNEAALRRALAKLGALEVVQGEPCAMRIEGE